MTNTLPAPFVPPEVDLRDFAFMPLEVRRLRDSRLVATLRAEEALAAILLWSASWHQVPAASLPDDDVELSALAGYGRAVREYKRIKSGSLYGFVKCSDGRLYHPVVAEKAAEGWNGKLKEQHRRACDRQRKANKERAERNEKPLPMPPHPPLLIQRNEGPFPCWLYEHSDGTTDPLPNNSGGSDVAFLRNSELKGEGERKGEGQCKGQGEVPVNLRQQQASTQPPEGCTEPPLRGGKVPGNATEQDNPRRQMAAALQAQGVIVTPGNPLLLAWITEHVTLHEVREAVDRARHHKPAPKPIPAKYLDPIIADIVRERGSSRHAVTSVKRRPWFIDSWTAIKSKAAELGITQGKDEADPAFRSRVFAAAGVTPEAVRQAELEFV